MYFNALIWKNWDYCKESCQHYLWLDNNHMLNCLALLHHECQHIGPNLQQRLQLSSLCVAMHCWVYMAEYAAQLSVSSGDMYRRTLNYINCISISQMFYSRLVWSIIQRLYCMVLLFHYRNIWQDQWTGSPHFLRPYGQVVFPSTKEQIQSTHFFQDSIPLATCSRSYSGASVPPEPWWCQVWIQWIRSILSNRAPTQQWAEMGSQAVERTVSSASIPTTKPPTSGQSDLRSCPPLGTGSCPYVWNLVCVP